MKIIGFWHICLINDYMQIISEQLDIIVKSKLYDKVSEIRIGCVGNDISKVKELIKPYKKISIKTHVTELGLYEFPTLKMLHELSQDQKFFGFYIHTKGVSWPGHEGGKYWRDYMNYYNLTQWKECLKKLNKGYQTCGVKLLTRKDPPAHKLHYSGNFFWFKSEYVSKLIDPLKLNLKDRFECEMWIGTGNPVACSLCQMFVDYNTKGVFKGDEKTSGKNYVHTLAYNLVRETEKAVDLLYRLNNSCDFIHYIVDLGFPLEKGDVIPDNIQESKIRNSERLMAMARRYGSKYIRIPNIGVSQNWTQVSKIINMNPEDILIGADPDEHPLNYNWVKAMGNVVRDKHKIGLVSLLMTDHEKLINSINGKMEAIGGEKCFIPKGSFNWALIGISGEFFSKVKEIPYPEDCPKYGYIESMLLPHFAKHGYKWVMLKDYKVKHTDYELGEPGASKLLREWKNQIIFRRHQTGQMDFDTYLQMRKTGKL